MKTNYQITSGPSKSELFDNIKYCASSNSQVKIFFGVHAPSAPATKISIREAIITSITLEDGSGQSFIIEGLLLSNGQKMKFKAHYNTQTRKGTIGELGNN